MIKVQIKSLFDLTFKNYTAGELYPELPTALIAEAKENKEAIIFWHYENDSELFTVYNIKRTLDEFHMDVTLDVPYFPHARMDRTKEPLYMFTLKNCAEIINSLNFYKVKTLDVHSSVARALINHLEDATPNALVKQVLLQEEYSIDTLMFPDAGAEKRYRNLCDTLNIHNVCYGMKDRDWSTRTIRNMNIESNFPLDEIKGRNVIIVDDICSTGYTFLFAAKKLKELGVAHVILFASHLENEVLNGELLKTNYVDRIYTTDSIFSAQHNKIKVLKL